MHRVFRAVPIAGAARFEELRAQVDPQRFSYLAYRWIASDFSVLLDIAGAVSAGELDRGLELCRKNVLTQTQAYAHLHGVTNTDPKWLLYYLEPIFARDARLAQAFFSLYHLDGVSEHGGRRRYIERSLDFVDELHRRARSLLRANPEIPSGAKGLATLKSRFDLESSRADRFRELEFCYRAKVYTETGLSSSRLLELVVRP